MHESPEGIPASLLPEQKQEIIGQLDRIIRSAAFRSSPRCQQLLTYVVTHAIAGEYNLLRERVVGAEVFGRSASYDTGGDSIVRVRANDLRKRLAQYYDGAPGRDREVRIQLLTGSYVPEFSFPPALLPVDIKTEHASPEPSSLLLPLPVALPASRRLRSLPWLVTSAVLAILLTGAFGVFHKSQRATLDRFWTPFLQSSESVLFCLGHAQVFTLSPEFRSAYFHDHPPSKDPEPRAVQLAPEQPVKGKDLVSVQGQFVGIGGAQSVQMLSSLFAARGKSSSLRIGSDLSFADLRTHPTVLIGAFSNRWTLQINRDVRFYFDEATGEQICDRKDPNVRWKLERNEEGREVVDYAVITRLLRWSSGQTVVDASGITQYGCRAAGELLANEQALGAAMRNAAAGWEDKNVQLVLRSRVVRMTAGPPEVIAVFVW